MTLAEASSNIGGRVIYSDVSGEAGAGVITRVSRRYVFVRYDGTGPAAKATPPECLVLESDRIRTEQ